MKKILAVMCVALIASVAQAGDVWLAPAGGGMNDDVTISIGEELTIEFWVDFNDAPSAGAGDLLGNAVMIAMDATIDAVNDTYYTDFNYVTPLHLGVVGYNTPAAPGGMVLTGRNAVAVTNLQAGQAVFDATIPGSTPWPISTGWIAGGAPHMVDQIILQGLAETGASPDHVIPPSQVYTTVAPGWIEMITNPLGGSSVGNPVAWNQLTTADDFGFPSKNTVEVTVIPEPATLALLGLGGLVALRRRR
jgi:hypothetical protein